jgi:hypothetical protein
MVVVVVYWQQTGAYPMVRVEAAAHSALVKRISRAFFLVSKVVVVHAQFLTTAKE